MKCPVCDIDLKMTDRKGVEIDYCPQCRGIWLDRGELDKVIERSAADSMPPAYSESPYQERRRDDRDDHERYGKHGKKRRKSFLDDLFDF